MVGRTAVLGAALLLGCFEPPSSAVARLEETKAEARALEVSLDIVEQRLLAGQAKVALWTEMAERHRRVSALACDSQTAHAAQMVALAEQQALKARRVKRGLVVKKGLAVKKVAAKKRLHHTGRSAIGARR